MSYSTLGSEWGNSRIIQSLKKSIQIPNSTFLNNIFLKWDSSSSEQATIDLLDRLFTFNDYMQVNNFLRKNTYLFPLLLETYEKIKSSFPDAISLALKVKTDGVSEHEKLYVIINSFSEDNYRILDELDDNWWIDAMPRAKSKLNIDLEY